MPTTAKTMSPGFQAPPLNEHYAGGYSAQMVEWRRVGGLDKASRIAALVEDAPVSSVLDVGCGTGVVLAEVARLGIGADYVGTDMEDPAAHLDPAAIGLRMVHAPDGRLPFADASFDLVYATNVLEHVADERGFLAEVLRVSAHFVFVEVPCELHMRTSTRALQRSLNIGHINSYTPESAKLTLETSGLRVIKERLFDHSFAVHSFFGGKSRAAAKMALRRALLGLSPNLASRLCTYHYAALCVRA